MGILLFLTFVMALGGVFLIGDFCLWYFMGYRVPAIIEGFEDGKPVLSFETLEGKKVKIKAEAITHLGYRLGAPQVGDLFNAAYREINGEGSGQISVRVHGFQNLIAGGVLLLPFFVTLGIKLSNSLIVGQISFLTVLIVLVIGGWAVLKMIRRNY